ncbi:16S rRNA (cytidine(1402)-2'-O)-methyltransferase [bacterium]|nr:16S rRNA (cytidine(1402)-2'-O)-methyltransferase [candidate division CSSED10-310 bacterium]
MEFEVTGGILYIVGTPIGNLEDITYRSVKTLKSADIIAAEDTRRTRKLLTHLGVAKPMIAYHDHNAAKAIPQLLEHIEQGDAVALVTDGGMPCISDPGYTLIAKCREAGFPVTVVPGPSAVTSALALAGIPSERFCFEGYLPRQKSERTRRWAMIAAESRAVVIYEAPHRMNIFLQEIARHIPDRIICICREITKLHEETIRGRAADIASDLLDENGSCSLKGEITIVIASENMKSQLLETSEMDSIIQKLAMTEKTHRDLAKKVSNQTAVPFRKVYKRILELIKMKRL